MPIHDNGGGELSRNIDDALETHIERMKNDPEYRKEQEVKQAQANAEHTDFASERFNETHKGWKQSPRRPKY